MNKYDNCTIKIKDNNRNFIYILCIYERVLSPSIPNKDMFFVEVLEVWPLNLLAFADSTPPASFLLPFLQILLHRVSAAAATKFKCCTFFLWLQLDAGVVVICRCAKICCAFFFAPPFFFSGVSICIFFTLAASV